MLIQTYLFMFINCAVYGIYMPIYRYVCMYVYIMHILRCLNEIVLGKHKSINF